MQDAHIPLRGSPLRVRIATITILGRPALRVSQNQLRGELLIKVARRIRRRLGWSNLDALLAPAGMFRSDNWYGHLPSPMRLELADEEEFGEFAVRAATILSSTSPGCPVVIGVDSRRPGRGFGGDQMVIAFGERGSSGLSRKSFPVDGDTNGWGRSPYLLFEEDGSDPWRGLKLPSGQTALLHSCYDAFALAEIVLGPTGKRRALRWAGDTDRWWRWFDEGEVDRWISGWAKSISQLRPNLNLVGVHGFEHPGGEVYWQRHGIATASAALGGIPTIGAGHYAHALPLGDGSPLAAFGVPISHIHDRQFRKAFLLKPKDHFEVWLRGEPHIRALIRLFDAP